MKQPERIAWGLLSLSLATWAVVGKSGSHPEGDAASAATPSSPRGRSRFSSNEAARRERPEREAGGVSGGVGTRSARALKAADPLVRMSEFLKILSSCDASSLAQVEKAMAELKASGISLPAEESLMDFRAGQLRGAELLANRTGSSDDLAKIGSVRKQFEGWAQSDPQAAAAWLDRLPNGKYRDQLAISYIGASAKDDPAGALHFVSSLRPSQQAEAGRMAAGRLMETGSVEDASAMLRTLESSGEKDDSAYLSAMFDTLARKAGGGDLAISLVESHLDRAYVNQAALNRVFALQAKEDPQRALGWALSMEGKKPGAQPGEMVWSAIKGMTVDGLKYAEDWAKSQPQADLWQQAIEKRKDLLEEHRGDENRYDKDD